MRSLERNKQTVYYALLEGVSDVTDEYGNPTGELKSEYGEPTELRINISPAGGEVATQMFGSIDDYDKVLMTTDDLPIDEQTVFWIDRLDTSKRHDYVVHRIAKSLNSASYAVKKVATGG